MATRFKKYSKEEIFEANQKLRETEFEKSDLLALTIAALITFVPMMMLVLGVMIGIVWLIFIR